MDLLVPISFYTFCFIPQDGQTALHQAASAGHGETVAALILGGCDVSLQDFVRHNITLSSLPPFPSQTGHTALQRAAAEGHVDIVKQLVKQGAAVDHQDEVVSRSRNSTRTRTKNQYQDQEQDQDKE